MDEFATHRAELGHDLGLIRDLDREDIDRIRYAILRARKEEMSIREAAPPKTSGQAVHRGEQVLVNLTEADSKFEADQVRELEALVEELPVTGERRLDLYFDRPRLERIARIRHGLNPRPVRRSSISAGNSEFALREFTVVPIAIVAAIVLFLVLWASRQGVLGNEG